MQFYTTGINKLISHWQKYAECNGSYFVNEDVFELSYNDLRISQVVLVVKNLPANAGRYRFNPWIGKIPCSKKWQPAPVFSPGKSHGQRSLGGYSPWGCKESNTAEQLGRAHNVIRILSAL